MVGCGEARDADVQSLPLGPNTISSAPVGIGEPAREHYPISDLDLAHIDALFECHGDPMERASVPWLSEEHWCEDFLLE